MRDGKVHLVDDDAAVRGSAAFLLECAGFDVVSYADAPSVLAALTSGLSLSCIVTDVRMPGMDGLDLARAALKIDPDVSIIVVTGHGDVPMAVEAMRSGAIDFIEKPFRDDVLILAVRSALAKSAAAPDDRGVLRRKIESLSIREREVLQGLLDGRPNKVIAHDLGISPRTVEVYRAKAMTKMGASSFAELVQMAIRANLDFMQAPLSRAGPE
jgi:two-component system response regulator FixJ